MTEHTLPAQRRGPWTWRRWTVLIGGFVTAGLLALALGTGFGRDPSVVASALLSKAAPALRGPTLEGGTFDLASYRGHPVLINVWASWCAPCKKEYPVLAAAAQQLGPRGLRLVGIDMSDKPADARAFLAERGGAHYPNVADPDARRAVVWGTFAVPETYLVDGGGVIRAKAVGVVTTDWVNQYVLPLLTS